MKMAKTILQPIFKAGYSLLAAISLVSLTACNSPINNQSISDFHPIKVGKETSTIKISHLKDQTNLSPIVMSDLKRFVTTFHKRGNGLFIVDIPQQNISDPEKSSWIRKLLWDEGVNDQQLLLRASNNASLDDSSVILTYVANTVIVPECGDWSDNNNLDWVNQSPKNFGCAQERNFGLMLANPGDYIRARPMDGEIQKRATLGFTAYEETIYSLPGSTYRSKVVGGTVSNDAATDESDATGSE